MTGDSNVVQAEIEANPFEAAKDKMAQFKRDHPHIAASASVGLAVGGGIVLIPALGILALNAIGFTAGGVAAGMLFKQHRRLWLILLFAGSLAAALQSIFYGGATTGLFSIFQSLGATAVLPAAGTVIASASAVGTGIASYFSGGGDDAGENDETAPPPASSSWVPGPPEGNYTTEK